MYEHKVLTKRGVSGLNVTVYDAVISSRSEETTHVLAQFHPRVEAGWWSRARLGHQPSAGRSSQAPAVETEWKY